jgi:type I restriction enzyme, S subunit
MRPEDLIDLFDQLADACGAVAKIREVVLWSAFSGAFAGEERDQAMPREWAVEGAPTLPPIPSSWQWKQGRDVFDVIRGVSYKKSDASEKLLPGLFPLLRANNIGGTINFENLVYVPGDNIREEQFVRCGDLLIAMSSGSKKLVGKAAPVVTRVKAAFGAFCGVIRNKGAIPNEVLARYFQSPQYTSWVVAAGRGIGINNLGKGDLDSLPIPIPPLAEQKRIVAKVDELMALCDRLEAQQKERETRHAALARASLARFADAPAPTNLTFLFHKSYTIPLADLRKTILTLAFQGKLVPQAPDDEPASLLLERLSRGLSPEQRRRRSESLSPSPSYATLPEVPDGWVWARFRDVAVIASNLVKPSNFLDLPHLAPDNIEKSTGVLLPCATVREDKVISSNHRFYPGQIIYSKIRPNLAKVVVVDFEGLCSADMYPIDPLIDTSYLHRYMLADAFLVQAVKTDTRVAMPKINQLELNAISVPVPPLAEQQRIVAKVDQLLAFVDELETHVSTSRAVAAKLLEGIVGELTA